jgi:hypothetical protein
MKINIPSVLLAPIMAFAAHTAIEQEIVKPHENEN